MRHRTLFITATDTGVGKTTLAELMVFRLRSGGFDVRAIKPFCSGGRADARRLAAAQGRGLPLEAINPWHFRAPLTPLLAARLENQTVAGLAVRRFIRHHQRSCEVLIVEGAGGVMSPLAEGLDARDLIAGCDARVIVVCPNRLGAISQALTAVGVLPTRARRHARLVLVQQRKPARASPGNLALLKELLGEQRVRWLPWLDRAGEPGRSLRRTAVRSAVDAILDGLI